MKHRLEITIAAPPKRVFAAYADPQLLPRWRTSIAEVVDVSGAMEGVGTTFTSVYRGRLPDSHGEVVASEPPRRHVMAGSGAAKYRAEATLEPAENGAATRLTFDLDARVPGGPLGRAAEKLVLQRKVARETEEDFARLKALIESER